MNGTQIKMLSLINLFTVIMARLRQEKLILINSDNVFPDMYEHIKKTLLLTCYNEES